MARTKTVKADKTPGVLAIERLMRSPKDYSGMRVAEFLNSGDKGGRRRIEELLNLLRELQRIPSIELQTAEPRIGDPENCSVALELITPHQTVQEINLRLNSYTVRLSLEVRGGMGGVEFKKVAADFEPDAANVLTELYKARKLHSIRKCDWCGDWFFARKESQLFCQTKCNTGCRRNTERGIAIHRAEVKVSDWKKQKSIWEKKTKELEAQITSARGLHLRQIESDLGNAKERHYNCMEKHKEAKKELETARALPKKES